MHIEANDVIQYSLLFMKLYYREILIQLIANNASLRVIQSTIDHDMDTVNNNKLCT